MTLYRPTHKVTGATTLPRATMTASVLDVVLFQDSANWKLKITSSGTEEAPLAPITQERLAEANEGRVFDPTDSELTAMLTDLEAEHCSEGRVDRPAAPNFHE